MARLIRALSTMMLAGLLVGVANASAPAAAGADAIRPPIGSLVAVGSYEWPSHSMYGGSWAQPDSHYCFTDPAGALHVASVDTALNTISVRTLDPSTLTQVGDVRSISFAGWPFWGGFYAAPDGCYYVLLGRDNDSESETRDVVAVRRYSSDWRLLGTAYVRGGASQGVSGIYSPLAYSAAQMVLAGDRLVVHMGRLMFKTSDGLHHQGNFTFEVDVDSMTATPFSELGGYAYSSHSFRQLVTMSGSDLVFVDHGDAYPRAIQMGVIAGYPAAREVAEYDLFHFNGRVGDNFTGATVMDMVAGPSGVVMVGTSIQHSVGGTLGSWDEHRNVYAISANPQTGAHSVNWLTAFAARGADEVMEPRIVQVAHDRYAVLFSVKRDGVYRTEYRLIDSAANVLAQTSFPGMYFGSASSPVKVGGRLYWMAFAAEAWDSPSTGYLFGLDASNPTAPALIDTAPFDSVVATIRSVSPNPASSTGTVRFAGGTEDSAGHAAAEYQWRSSVDGTLSSSAEFSRSSLTVGEHVITFRARCANGTWSDETSMTITVEPGRPLLGNPTAPSTMYRTQYYALNGTLRPRHPQGSTPVRIYKYRLVSGRWRGYGYDTATVQDRSTYSRYSARIRLPYRGRWRLRAYAPADDQHLAAWSERFDYVTVQ